MDNNLVVMMKCGEGYFLSAVACLEQYKSHKPYRIEFLSPSFLLASLAIEISLKINISQCKKDYTKTHDLRELFDALDQTKKTAFEVRYNALCQSSSDTNFSSMKFGDSLNKYRLYFTQGRYYYEPSSLIDYHVSDMVNLMNAICVPSLGGLVKEYVFQ